MSGLEVITSIAGVMGTSLKLFLTLSQIADDIGSTGKDVRIISGEMASLQVQTNKFVFNGLAHSGNSAREIV